MFFSRPPPSTIRAISSQIKRFSRTMPEISHTEEFPSILIKSIPTTEITVDRLKDLLKNTFLDTKTRYPSIEWAGVFGSVSRGTQRPDSDIDLIIGHASNADYFSDVGGSMQDLQENLPEALGREVDIVHVVRGGSLGYVQMEALLSCKTVWGDPSWPDQSKELAKQLLRDGYVRTARATALFKDILAELPSKEEFTSAEGHDLRQAILSKILKVIEFLRPEGDHPFSGTCSQLFAWLFSQEKNVQDCLQSGNVDESRDKLVDIWTSLSDQINHISFKAMIEMAEQSFRRGGMEIPKASDNLPDQAMAG